jgi:hypothetical protein
MAQIRDIQIKSVKRASREATKRFDGRTRFHSPTKVRPERKKTTRQILLSMG